MTNSIDIANARIKFENGSIANITSSRIAKDKVRKIKLFQQDLYITIDFLSSITEIYRAMDANQRDEKAIMSAIMETNGKQRQIFYEKPTIQKKDALRYELINFVNSIQKKEKPLVDGLSGRNALEIAMKIQNKIIEDKDGY
jgi:predicted dehydrogenase